MTLSHQKQFGQYFTPQSVVDRMIALAQNGGLWLEPSAGDGSFTKRFENRKFESFEVDYELAKANGHAYRDFFMIPTEKKYSTIIGNPPYVRYQDIWTSTKNYLQKFHKLFGKSSNLYLFFIYKCILHLEEGGELIFITPRDFIKATSAKKLNKFIMEQGTLTHYYEMGDKRIFQDATPNTAIWRFEKGSFAREVETGEGEKFLYCWGGQLLFAKEKYSIPLSDIVEVKVGSVSGADVIFEHPDGIEMVYSKTRSTGKTKRMIYYKKHPHLEKCKQTLLNRKIRNFNESNWWEWGRRFCDRKGARIYVNCKTRHQNPFFVSEIEAYDGSVLSLFSRAEWGMGKWEEFCRDLNSVDWKDLGFVIDGRLCLTQRSLYNILLPKQFEKYLGEIDESR